MPFDPKQIKLKTKWDHPEVFHALVGDCCGARLFAGSSDYGLHLFDPKKKEPVGRWNGHDNYVSAVTFAITPKDDRFVITGGYDRKLVWWNEVNGQQVRSLAAHDGWVRGLVVNPDGTLIASVGDDMLVKVWRTDTGELVRTLSGHAKLTPQGHVTALYAVAISPDGKHVAAGDRIGQVRVWELETGVERATFEVPVLYTYDGKQRKRSIGGIRSLAFSPDGKRIAVGGIGQIGNVDGLEGPATVELWDWQTPRKVFASECEGHKALINALVFHPEGTWLIGAGGGGDGGLLACWKADVPTPEPKTAEETAKEKDKAKSTPVPIHKIKTDGHLHGLVLHADSGMLYTAGYHRLESWTLT